jgi:hypothetical protein
MLGYYIREPSNVRDCVVSRRTLSRSKCMSSDYLCAARCGFPFPRQMVIDLDADGMLKFCDFAITRKPKWPIAARSIISPVMQIYQPILHGSVEELSKFQADPWVKANLIAGSDRQGLPVRQRHASVEVIADMSSTIEFDEVAGKHCRPLKDIIAQTYDLQIATSNAVRYRSLSPDALDNMKRLIRLAGQANAHARNAFAEMKRDEI